jgi:multidrug efflux pump subunit AcrA (membrane-fusion protein)
MRRHLLLGTLLAAPVVVGCGGSDSSTKPSGGASVVETAAKVEVGSALFAPTNGEVLAAPEVVEQTIVIPSATVRMDKKQTVAAEVDGRLEIIGMMLPPGYKVGPNEKDIFYDPNDKQRQLPFKRLRIGDPVTKGMVVCLLNDLEALVQIEASQKIKIASEQAIKESREGTVSIEKSLDILRKSGASPTEILNAEATLSRYRENIFTGERELAKADADEKRAMVLRSKHRSTAAVSGIITNIMQEPGQYVKAGEPMMEILSLEDIRIEGTLEAHYADTVKPGMKVKIEPTLPVGPEMKMGHIAHRLEVTGVAVTSHPGRPLVVSASLDGTATVWDAMAPAGKPKTQTRLSHPVAVRSVAVTGAKAGKHLAATGGDDGRVRLWDLSNPDRVASEKPMKEYEISHASGVATLDFSPDGRYLVSAAGREIFLWDVAGEKKLPTLSSEHKDAVTSIKFTPQSKLVTVSRDKTVRVWSVGEKGAAVDRIIDHRKGNVDTLGISSAGGRALFDQEDGRIDVVSLADGQPVGSILNAAAGARFSTLALFSPTDEFVLTAGGDGDMRGELQVFTTPKPGGRGAEVRRLITPYRSMPTCAAFGPNFVVVGTQAGGVHLWTVDTLKNASQERLGRVISVIRSDARNVKVRVETSALVGELGSLQDKSTATLIIHPGDAVTPPAPLPIPGAAASPMPNVIIPAGGVIVPDVKIK